MVDVFVVYLKQYSINDCEPDPYKGSMNDVEHLILYILVKIWVTCYFYPSKVGHVMFSWLGSSRVWTEKLAETEIDHVLFVMD